MRFLESPPRFLFFTGKGGVGKTSVACATAIRLAEGGRRVLLVSTDPASNVGQVFGVPVGNRITDLDAVPGLAALEIDPQGAAQAYRDRIVGPVRGLLPDAVVRGIEEQLSGACTTEIAAFDEFTALLTDSALTAQYDHIVFDTAPTGHTLRLLRLPGAWNGFLETGKGDASCLGPLAGLDKQRSQYKAAVDALADPERTRLILVARAQAAALREVARTHDELAAIGLARQHLVINGILPPGEAGDDPLALAIVDRERTALDAIPAALRALPLDRIELKPFNMVGLDALRRLLDAGPAQPAISPALDPLVAPGLPDLIDGIAAGGHGLVMLMGKGGVGKTTLAAAIAVALARRGLPVHLSTSDPAAHLAEALPETVEHLTVSRIDPRIETERYRAQVLDTQGRTLDAQGRALLEEDLRSPCTEEIAVFQAFSRVIREAGRKFVVMDTAPTGHTLLLLDATGAYHREVSRQTGAGQPVVTQLMSLQDSQQTKVLIVALAETTPVLEAANLQADLRRAGIEPWAWIVNQSLLAAQTDAPLLRQRARNERAEIDKVARRHAQRHAVIPLLAEEPIGAGRLEALSRSSSQTAAASDYPLRSLSQTPETKDFSMTDKKPLHVLVLCTGNSCRSVLGEALVNHLGAGRLRASSAGSHPLGRINPGALATLARHGLPTEGYRSQSWDEFEDAGIDILISVCDSAGGETCPAYLGKAVRGHWGLPDPAHAVGSPAEVEAAFEAAYAALEKRINALLALPFETLSGPELSEALNRIGATID